MYQIALITKKCTHCGANIEIDDTTENGICPHCQNLLTLQENNKPAPTMSQKKAFIIFGVIITVSIIITVLLIVFAAKEDNLTAKVELIIGAIVCGVGAFIGLIGFIVVFVMKIGLRARIDQMTKESEEQIRQIEKIVANRDLEALFLWKDDTFFSIALRDILDKQCDYKPAELNHSQRVLFLCIRLENFGQSDGILTFLQEKYPEYANEVTTALCEIGAPKSAELIKQAVELLPKDGTWFYKVADEKAQDIMKKIDSEFSSYPDGKLDKLYRIYAEKHKAELF